MDQFPLNSIVHNETGWCSNVLSFDTINVGGLYIEYDTKLKSFKINDCYFRVYKHSRILVASSHVETEDRYAAVKLDYDQWLCRLCRKVNRFNEAVCYCNSLSSCWTPLDYKISGVYTNTDMNFVYHFENKEKLNIIMSTTDS